jgi:hypothetical protein
MIGPNLKMENFMVTIIRWNFLKELKTKFLSKKKKFKIIIRTINIFNPIFFDNLIV